LAATLIYALEPPTTLVTVLVGFVVIYWFARWASGHRSGGGELEPPLKELAAPEPVYVDPEYVGKSGEGFVTRKFYFDNFDPVPGPPDPENSVTS
jgi:hypothetical protein